MKKTFTCLILTITFLCIPSSATIINVPSDQPNIQAGIDSSSNGDTVLVQPNTYYENINFNGHNITLGSFFLTTGDTSYIHSTEIDGDTSGSVIIFENGEDNTAIIIGFTLQNGHSNSGGGIYCNGSSPTIRDNIIDGNFVYINGGGIYCENSNPLIINNTISGNSSFNGTGGGIHCWNYSNPTISKNTITGNSADDGGGICCLQYSNPTISANIIKYNSACPGGLGGGIYYSACDPVIVNNIIAENIATSWLGGFGGGIYCSNSNSIVMNNVVTKNFARYGGGIYSEGTSIFTMINTILWGDSAAGGGDEIFIDDVVWPLITYCDIEDTLWPGVGNISINPLFRDPLNGDFHLMAIICGDSADSPCIDAGDPDILDSLLDCAWGLGTIRSDMGAYGGGDSAVVFVDDNKPKIPSVFSLSQNYPNPFNSSTAIEYGLKQDAHVTIEIYDLLGCKVETLINSNQSAGYHQAFWNASGFSSGVYFYKIIAGDFSKTRKMLLLK